MIECAPMIIVILLCACLFEPAKPLAHSVELLIIDSVYARTPCLLMREESGLFQNTQMTTRRRPRTAKAPGDLAGRHSTAAELDHQQNVPPRRMGQRGENFLDLLESQAGIK